MERKERLRSHIGYGSSYRKGEREDLGSQSEIGAVMGGQIWMVKPDKDVHAANPCIWMQSGVVNFKSCNHFYDCNTCKYDLGMRRRVDQGLQISWQDAMRKRPSLQRSCRHSLTKRISMRACAYDYQCATCDFDQLFEDVWAPRTGMKPLEVQNVKGFNVPMGYYAHNGHTWVRVESGGNMRIGLDDFILKLLGKADKFDLPLVGKVLDHGKAGWGLKRQGNPADILSPIDGVIVDVNFQARENPALANEDPYGKGWLFMVRTPDIKAEAERLMVDTDTLEWMTQEVTRLEIMIEKTAGPLAADGGYLSNDIYGNLPGLGWSNLTKNFLGV
ncbi:MAG: glycine cleavage system protein H [Deltaproteobacteria bacterium]|nr:glycine cleavage system protein H [Deltaproteobacteria bacterium]